MFTDLSKFLTDLLASFRTVFRIGSVPPSQIEGQEDHTRLNFSALVVATFLYFISMAVYAPIGDEISLFDSFLVNLAFVVAAVATIFLVSFATATFNAEPSADTLADQWTTFFAHVWILSLLAFAIDIGIAQVTGGVSISTRVNGFLGGWFNPAVFYTLVALIFVAFRSKVAFKRRLRDRACIYAFLVALIFNSVFFYVMVYFLPFLQTARPSGLEPVP